MSHLKSFTVPKSWSLKKKENVFTVRPLPGAHPNNLSVSFTHMIRTMNLGSTVKEIKKVVNNRSVLVDRKPVRNHKFPVGFMDVITFIPMDESYRVLIDTKGKLKYNKVSDSDSKFKISKVLSKSILKGGKTQLNLSSGRNTLSDAECSVGDSVVLSLPEQKVDKVLKMEKGAKVFLLGGRHIGHSGIVEDISGNTIWFKTGDGVFETLKEYAFVVGDLVKNE